jgi:hypothetical protein
MVSLVRISCRCQVLNGKRGLSMTMLRKLRDRFHVSADLLIWPRCNPPLACSGRNVRLRTHKGATRLDYGTRVCQ